VTDYDQNTTKEGVSAGRIPGIVGPRQGLVDAAKLKNNQLKTELFTNEDYKSDIKVLATISKRIDNQELESLSPEEQIAINDIKAAISTMYRNIMEKCERTDKSVTLPSSSDEIHRIIDAAQKCVKTTIETAQIKSAEGKVSFSEGFKSFLASAKTLLSTGSFKAAKERFQTAKEEAKGQRSPTLNALKNTLPKEETEKVSPKP